MKPSLYGKLISNHPLANIIFVLVLAIGVVAYVTMPRAQDPQVNFNWVSVTTILPGASAEDVEREVTAPLEDAIAKVKDVRFYSSVSRTAVSSILVRFQDISRTQFDKRLADLRREIQNKVSSEFPEEAKDPQVLEITSSNSYPTVQVMVFGVEGEALRREAAQLRRDMERLPGVDQVRALGLDDPQLLVEFDPLRLRAAKLSPVGFLNGVSAWFRDVIAGKIDAGGAEWLVKFEGKSASSQALSQAGIVTPRGRIAIEEVATVQRGHAQSRMVASYRNQPAVLMMVTKQGDANSLKMTESVQQFVAERNQRLASKGVQLDLIDDQTYATRSAISVMESNALIGVFAVLGFCWLFLGSRLSLLVTLGVPFSLAGAFIAVDLMGSTLDRSVLLAIVIALGMVVDDAVVVVETVYYRMTRGESALNAVVGAVREVAAPVFAAILTTVAAFLPLMLLPGVLGKFMFIIPFVVTVALLVSLVEAFWILPAHVLAARPRLADSVSRVQQLRITVTHWLRLRYAQSLIRVMRFPKLGVSVLLLMVVCAFALLSHQMSNADFFASNLKRIFFVQLDMPTGTPLQQTMTQTRRLEGLIKHYVTDDELRSIASLAGIKYSETEPVYGAHYGQVVVSLVPQKDGLRSAEDVIAKLRPAVKAFTGGVSTGILEISGGPPVTKPISVKVLSNDWQSLSAAAHALKKALADIPGVYNIADNNISDQRLLRLQPNRERLANAGVSPAELARTLVLYGDGATIASVRDRGEKVDVVVRAQRGQYDDVMELLQHLVTNRAGESVPIREVVDTRLERSRGFVRHYLGSRAITVDADIDKSVTDVVTANRLLKQAWQTLQPQFSEVSLDFSGLLDDIQESLEALLWLLLLGVGLIYLVLATQFRSYFQPFIILTTLPLSMTGVLLGLWVSGQPLSLYTLYGMVALVGIAVNAAIVLIAAANERLAEGMSVLHASVYAARRRIIPILITTVTTIGGLFSLAMGFGGESAAWGPVASSIVWGLGFSSVLTLYAIPLIWRLSMERQEKKRAKKAITVQA